MQAVNLGRISASPVALSLVILFTFSGVVRAGAVDARLNADALKLAQQFEADIKAQKKEAAAALIDGNALLARSEAGIAAPADIVQEFAQVGSILASTMTNSLVDQVLRGGEYKFIRLHNRNGEPAAVFRLDLADKSMNYFELHIGRDSAGHARVVDIYDLARGEKSSIGVRRFFLAAVISEDKTMAAKIGDRETLLVDNVPKLQEMTKDAGSGQYQKVLDIYQTLPAEVQHDKSALYLRMSAADQMADTDPKAYREALADFEKFFPNDPAIDFMGLDRSVLDGKYDEAQKAVGRLEAFTGPEAHWDYLRGHIIYLSGATAEYPKAEAAFRQAITEDPQRHEAYWALVDLYLAEKKWTATAAMLTQIESDLRITIKDLTKISAYSEFVKSKEFKSWLATQPKPTSN